MTCCSPTWSRPIRLPLRLQSAVRRHLSHFRSWYLERVVIDGTQSALRRLQCGFMLLAIWASLRLSDCVWRSPTQIHAAAGALLGTARWTQVTSRAMPWAIQTSGLLNKSWALLWLQLLQAAAARTTSLHGIKPEFLFAKLGDSAEAPHFLEPMNRDEELVMLRQYLHECYCNVPRESRPDLTLAGVHSF